MQHRLLIPIFQEVSNLWGVPATALILFCEGFAVALATSVESLFDSSSEKVAL